MVTMMIVQDAVMVMMMVMMLLIKRAHLEWVLVTGYASRGRILLVCEHASLIHLNRARALIDNYRGV